MSDAAPILDEELEPQKDSPFGMSDEDFLSGPPLEDAPVAPDELTEDGTADDDSNDDEADEDQSDKDQAEADESTKAADDAADDAGDGEPTADAGEEGESSDADEKEGDAAEKDYKAEFEKLTAPFRANGKDMQIENVDDAIKLMQMGANYNRKMAGMKPGLKVLKLLEKHKLLDEDKLSYLIDLDGKNPEAIKKLLKDSDIDPVDLAHGEDDAGKEYKAPNRNVSESELEMESVIEDLRDSDHYSKTLEIVGSTWDENSKQIVADQPNLLRVINDHVARGIYDLISTEVEQERMFGRVDGSLSDIDAYRTVGDAMEARGAFSHLNPNQGAGDVQPVPKQPVKKEADDQARRAMRKAAGPTKPAASKADADTDYNPLALSDEAFMKQVDSRLM
jgi:hypothetical protein